MCSQDGVNKLNWTSMYVVKGWLINMLTPQKSSKNVKIQIGRIHLLKAYDGFMLSERSNLQYECYSKLNWTQSEQNVKKNLSNFHSQKKLICFSKLLTGAYSVSKNTLPAFGWPSIAHTLLPSSVSKVNKFPNDIVYHVTMVSFSTQDIDDIFRGACGQF